MTATANEPLPLLDLPDEGIAMPDGTRLSARIWRPDAPGRYPAILEFIPYRKRDGTLARDERMHPWWAARGYACLRVDLRGSGDSEGLLTDEYTPQELADACAVIGWAAARPWCTGAVGMMGKSWGAFNSLQTAALAPPALKAVIAVCGTTDRFADDIHFKGGCLMGENLGWGATMLSYSSRPGDPLLDAGWRARWLERLAEQPFHAPEWASHQARDAYWRHGSVCEDWAAIRAPVLAIGGWADGYMNMVPALLENLSVPVKGIVGPWVHQYPHTAVPGPRIGFLQEAQRWWDRWLKGEANGVEDDPALRAFMPHSALPDASVAERPGRWVAETAWPSPRVVPTPLGLAPGRLGQGTAMDLPVSTPQHLGLHAGEYFPMGLNAEMPGDQAADDAMSVVFDTEPLAEGMALLGAAVLRLRLSSDSPRAHLVARLCDVAPGGASTRIAHGMLNLCHRDDPANPSDVPVGTPFDIVLRLDHCAHRLAPGHRLRLALSTTYWPFLWPAGRSAVLTLQDGTLTVPTHQGSDGDEWVFPPPHVPDGAGVAALTPPEAVRRIEHDLLTGEISLVVDDATGRQMVERHGRVVAERTTERWTIRPDDPLSARATIDWHQHHARGAWEITTEARVAMTATAEAFRMTATLIAREGGIEVFRRDWDESVARRFA
ncbi:MAG: CocE/NonD family hydrolase [Paracoccaceae bacterium]|nr:MAG: CocE/NonD family hydrolase [Paracoccaceae bacterium]